MPEQPEEAGTVSSTQSGRVTYIYPGDEEEPSAASPQPPPFGPDHPDWPWKQGERPPQRYR